MKDVETLLSYCIAFPQGYALLVDAVELQLTLV